MKDYKETLIDFIERYDTTTAYICSSYFCEEGKCSLVTKDRSCIFFLDIDKRSTSKKELIIYSLKKFPTLLLEGKRK